jgi:hypothetical protein
MAPNGPRQTKESNAAFFPVSIDCGAAPPIESLMAV